VVRDGWLLEAAPAPGRPLWVWGAGHVGRAIVSVLAPWPGAAITWVDLGPDRFPARVPEGVTVLPATEPAALVRYAPADADHLVLTRSHELDLQLCHALLGHGFASLGLIGSRTKMARFRARLAALGHAPAQIARIACPIGDPGLGKHPQAIAVGVAAALIRADTRESRERGAAG
jgi:xanthine dehydrogenase accessory factor